VAWRPGRGRQAPLRRTVSRGDACCGSVCFVVSSWLSSGRPAVVPLLRGMPTLLGVVNGIARWPRRFESACWLLGPRRAHPRLPGGPVSGRLLTGPGGGHPGGSAGAVAGRQGRPGLLPQRRQCRVRRALDQTSERVRAAGARPEPGDTSSNAAARGRVDRVAVWVLHLLCSC
jgi:hypothetical protein